MSRNIRLLIVEDDTDMCDMYRDLLGSCAPHITAVCAQSGAAGL